MAITAKWYGMALLSILGGATKAEARKIDWLSDTIKVMLTTGDYIPDQDTHQFKSSVTNEVVGDGYTAGGVTLANKTISYTAGTNTVMLDADDAEWANATITARIAVIYDDTPVLDADKPLIGYIDFGENKSSSAGTFKIQWAAGGICTLTAS